MKTAGIGASIAVLCVLAVGCSSGDQAPSTPSSAGTPTSAGAVTSSGDTSSAAPTTSGPSPSASAAALEAYRGFWAARVEANAHPQERVPPGLSRYAIDTALANDQASIIELRQEGVEYRGEPSMDPRVISVQLGDPPKVTIADCIDVSRWVPVYATTGKSAVAPGQPTRVTTQSMATMYAGRWVIRTHEVFRDRPC